MCLSLKMFERKKNRGSFHVSGKVLIVPQTLLEMFLVGRLDSLRNKKGQIGNIPEKFGKVIKKDKKGQRRTKKGKKGKKGQKKDNK